MLVNLAPELHRAFRTAHFISDEVIIAPDLDRALESCEQQIIESHRSGGDDAGSLRSWLSEALGDPALADRLTDYCKRMEVHEGDVIAREGDAASSMHFLLEGRIGIVVDVGDGRTMRVRSLGRHTTIGEMGLITGRPRSATIVAEAESVLFELTATDYARIKTEEPALSQALLGYIVGVMSER